MAFRKRTNAYWDKRAAEQLAYVEQQALPYLRAIDRVYLEARRANLAAVFKLYEAAYKKNGWDVQKLRQIAPSGDILRFQEAVRAAGLIAELPEGYGFRLSRLELLEAQMWLESKKAAQLHLAIQTNAHRQTINTAYNYAMYNLSKGTGVAPAFAQINTRAVNRILKTKFHGQNYSKRIWKNSELLASGLKNDLAVAVITGQSHSRTIKQLKDRYNVTRFQAARLVRTETNHFNTLASIESYKGIGIKEFVYVATLDTRTSSICQALDGNRFPVTSSENYPPQHPNCRSTTRAYLGEEYEPDARIMRDPNTGRNRYIGNISYDQWRERMAESSSAGMAASTSGAIVMLNSGLKYNAITTARLDSTIFRDSVAEINSILEDYPSLRKGLGPNGIELKASNMQAKGATQRNNAVIMLSTQHLRDKQSYIGSLANEISNGFKMKVPKRKYTRYTATHEMGHVIENHLMGKDVMSDKLARSIQNDIIGIAEGISGKSRATLLGEMSDYGMRNPREFFAEAFVSYRLGGRTIWAKAMGQYLAERLK